MILAGIDEAGYGPILGPLSVGCCALRLADGRVAPGEPLPDAWKLLRRCISRKRDRKGRKLHVNDSKQVYSPAAGLAQLERSVLAWLAAAGHATADLDELLALVLPASPPPELAKIAWYEPPPGELHPAAVSATSVAIAGNALRQECRAAGVEVLTPRGELLLERSFNRMCDATRNKGSVLFTLASRHIDRLLADHGREGVTIVCDRHGGRSHYGSLLRLMWPEWELAILQETETRAEYLLTRVAGGAAQRARLIFVEKGDGLCLATAMASMLAKYLRERLMGRFNAFWRSHEPALTPTAGYWSDGLRFLKEIEPLRHRLRVRDEALVRQR